MTARRIAKILGNEPAKFGGRGRDAFVVLPYAAYQRLCDAVEDALDLMDLEEARRESAGQKLVPWEDVKRRLGVGGKTRSRAKREGKSRQSR